MEQFSLYGLLVYRLIKTNKRLTFDIISMDDRIRFKGADDEDYYMFVASNGYQVMSRSRMDIQTERIWLLGGTQDDIAERSGTMVFSSNEKRDLAFDNFNKALAEWIDHVMTADRMKRLSDYTDTGWHVTREVLPEAGRHIIKKWKSGSVHAGRYSGSPKDSSFDFWKYLD